MWCAHRHVHAHVNRHVHRHVWATAVLFQRKLIDDPPPPPSLAPERGFFKRPLGGCRRRLPRGFEPTRMAHQDGVGVLTGVGFGGATGLDRSLAPSAMARPAPWLPKCSSKKGRMLCWRQRRRRQLCSVCRHIYVHVHATYMCIVIDMYLDKCTDMCVAESILPQ